MKTYTRFWAHERSHPCSAHTQFLSHFGPLTEIVKIEFFHVHTVHLDNYQSFFYQLMHNWIVLKTILNLH